MSLSSQKPIHPCYTCLLNLGDHCWLYRYPRGQWRGHRRCPAFGSEDVYREFRLAQKQPAVKTGRELRRDAFRSRGKRRLHHGCEAARQAP